jgi:pheromone shutdown protein TraB
MSTSTKSHGWPWLASLCLIISWIALAEGSTGFQNPTFVPPTTPTVPSDTSSSVTVTSSSSSSSNNGTSPSNSNSTAPARIPEWKQRLPAPLNQKTKTLQRILVPGPGGRCVEVYLLGTAHVSIDSSREVRSLLEAVQPTVLFLELCDQRIPMLVAKTPPKTEVEDPEAAATTTTTTTKLNLWQRIRQPRRPKEAKSMYGMAASLLTNMQQDYAESLDVELGGEFRAAYEYWDQHRRSLLSSSSSLDGANHTIDNSNNNNAALHMILGDRPLYLTLTRAWESLGVWGKTKLMFGLVLSSFQKPNPDELREWMQNILSDDTGDLLTESIAELAQHFPTLEHVIIKERDAYMASKLYQTCRQLLSVSSAPQTTRLVAIVGAGHVEGMCHWLTEGNGQTPEQILEPLIKIKKAIPKEDCQILVHDIMEVNHQLLQNMMQEL